MLRPEKIRYFHLHLDGGYIAEMAVQYRAVGTIEWTKETWGENLTKGQSKTIDAGMNGDETVVPAGYEMMLHMNVKAGDDREAFDTFIYDPTSTLQANYISCGGTQSTELGFSSITTHG